MWEKVREDGKRKLKSNAVSTLFFLKPKSISKPPAKRQQILKATAQLPSVEANNGSSCIESHTESDSNEEAEDSTNMQEKNEKI